MFSKCVPLNSIQVSHNMLDIVWARCGMADADCYSCWRCGLVVPAAFCDDPTPADVGFKGFG